MKYSQGYGDADDFAASARELLSRRWTGHDLREAAAGGSLPGSIWADAAKAGWLHMLVSEARGGLGLDATAAGAVFEECGRYLFPGPFFDTAVVGAVCRTRREVAPDDAMLSFASAELGSECKPAWSNTEINGNRIEGDKVLVAYAAVADYLVVTSRRNGHVVFCLVSPEAPGVEIEVDRSIDIVHQPCRVGFRGAPILDVVLEGEAASETVARVTNWAYVAHASRMLGVMEAVLTMSLEYAKQRIQFGRPIASFQAVQQRLADMRLSATTTRNICHAGQVSLKDSVVSAARTARAAKAHASAAGRRVVESALQIHGGIGFTADYDLHLYFKHALTLQGTWGDEQELGRTLVGDRLEALKDQSDADRKGSMHDN